MRPHRTPTPIRIDFTPFVSIALLLIVFFVWMKMVQRSNLMPTSIRSGSMCYWEERPTADAHLFLLDNNRIGFLTYRPDGSGAEFLETDYSASGIRNQLMGITLNHEYGAIVLISPTKKVTFKNVVDILDELQILGHLRFNLNYDLTPEERNLISNYEGYKATNPKSPVSLHVALYPKRIIDA